jgi:vacuolar-type H+-ATPase subunit H
MEKVWEELKKIEAQADNIHAEADKTAKEIVEFARKEAENLLQNSKAYAEEEASEIYSQTVQEADSRREDQLKANQKTADKLRAKAEKRLDKASAAVERAVLGEI